MYQNDKNIDHSRTFILGNVTEMLYLDHLSIFTLKTFKKKLSFSIDGDPYMAVL